MFRYCTWLLVAGLFFQVTGCSSGGGGAGAEKAKTVPLSGTLTLDGKPYGNVRVQFIPQGADGGVRTAYSEVKADGAFSATTYVTGDGIVAGKYDVRVGSDADTASTDPAAMMAAVAGASIEKMEVDVPADGLKDVELKLVSSKKKSGGGKGVGIGL